MSSWRESGDFEYRGRKAQGEDGGRKTGLSANEALWEELEAL